VRIEITALGETVMRRELIRFADNLANPRIALETAAITLETAAEEQFDTEGAHASGGWAPLALSTIQEKDRKGLSPHILQATGRLRDSLTRKFDPSHVERLSEDSLTFGTTVPYAIFHQTGTRRMPRRPPVALSEDDKRLIVKGIQRALLAGVRR
jgi:phage gpG-like protein